MSDKINGCVRFVKKHFSRTKRSRVGFDLFVFFNLIKKQHTKVNIIFDNLWNQHFSPHLVSQKKKVNLILSIKLFSERGGTNIESVLNYKNQNTIISWDYGWMTISNVMLFGSIINRLFKL